MFLFGYTSRLIASSEAQSEVAQWQQEVDLAKQRLAENQARLEYAKTDAYVIEKAHSDLGWAFPGEVAVWVVGDENRRSRRRSRCRADALLAAVAKSFFRPVASI